MKLTRSLPANAIASANVPSSTTTFSTGTFSALRNVISTEKTSSPPPIIYHVFSLTNVFSSGVMSEESFSPLMSRNQMMLVTAMPEKTPIFIDELTSPPIEPSAAVVLPLMR